MLSLTILQDAAVTFPANTGLGWDKMHPRAVARCCKETLLALIRLFILAELVGRWPQMVGITLICLLPKPDGGRRPIGLLPSVIRWWMRARLDVVRAWQTANDRPYFYAGPRKGAEVAAWKQAARAELAQSEFANLMLDMVKAFERVSYQWLINQGARYSYPMTVLRLSIAAYRLPRALTVDGICSVLLLANRGITAGAVHATIEVRSLLIQWVDETTAVFRLITITVYVDDTSLEGSGSSKTVKDNVIGAGQMFTQSLERVGMDFSPTKNTCIASTTELANAIVRSLPDLAIKIARVAKSLGGAVCNGKVRNAKVMQK